MPNAMSSSACDLVFLFDTDKEGGGLRDVASEANDLQEVMRSFALPAVQEPGLFMRNPTQF